MSLHEEKILQDVQVAVELRRSRFNPAPIAVEYGLADDFANDGGRFGLCRASRGLVSGCWFFEENVTTPTMMPDESGAMASWSDTRLIQECLAGNEFAWTALIHKYKRLIFSIPIKYGATREDAADIVQSVSLKLFSELSNLRKTESLKAWLISVTAHQSFQWKKRQRPGQVDLDSMEPEEADTRVKSTAVLPTRILEEVEQEEMVREALRKLPSRCAEMIRLLFYEDPPLPYADGAWSA